MKNNDKLNKTILKITVSTIIILLTVLVCHRYIYIQARTSVDFSEILKNEKIEDLTLTIYCWDPRFISSYSYSSAEELIMAEKYNYVCKFVVQGETLKEYIDTFKQINKANIKPLLKKAKYVDATTYYILESKNNGKLFDVLLWGFYDIPVQEPVIFLNGVEIKKEQTFCDIIKPFLPEDMRNSIDW